MSAFAKLKEDKEEFIQWRQHIHAHPETAFEEFETADYVADLLTSWGLKIDRGMAKTAVIATIEGKTNKSGRTVGLRADLDGLNIHEKTNVSYCSTIDGKMHACGHDGHTAMLLAATKHLAETRDFDGTVYAIFQPAEEGGGGANVMVKEGFFKKFPCDAIFGMHNWPWLPAGTMSISPGPMTAATDSFSIKIIGKGGHAAFPHATIDVITTASIIVTSLQTLVSRKVDPVDSAVVSVCKFHAGTNSLNVIPEVVEIGGSVRSFKAETRKMLEDGIRLMATSIAKAHGAKVEIEWVPGYPSVVNSEKEAQLCWDVACKIVGAENVSKFTHAMGAEDFAYFLETCPGAYIALGQAKEKDSPALHSPHYDFNDDVLPVGAAYWVELAETALSIKD